jgi:hypothetical protein
MSFGWPRFSSLDENRQAEKEEAAAEKEDGKKKRGGVQVPAEWPWEEAKKVFEQPDVTPSEQVDVGSSPVCGPVTNSLSRSWNGRRRMSKDSLTSW